MLWFPVYRCPAPTTAVDLFRGPAPTCFDCCCRVAALLFSSVPESCVGCRGLCDARIIFFISRFCVHKCILKFNYRLSNATGSL